jgi:glutamine amidotransferase
LFKGDAFAGEHKLKVPHMGWNRVEQLVNSQGQNHPLWKAIAQNERCYFVHSYYVEAENKSHVSACTEYGLRFASALSRDNVFAVQFHPEKSHRAGLQLLENFTRWDGQGI